MLGGRARSSSNIMACVMDYKAMKWAMSHHGPQGLFIVAGIPAAIRFRLFFFLLLAVLAVES